MGKLSASTLTSGPTLGAAQVFKLKEPKLTRSQKNASTPQAPKGDVWDMPKPPWSRDVSSMLKLGELYQESVYKGAPPYVLSNIQRQLDLFSDISTQFGENWNKINQDDYDLYTDESLGVWQNFAENTDPELWYIDDTGTVYYDAVPFLNNNKFTKLPILEEKSTYNFVEQLIKNVSATTEKIEDGDITTKTAANRAIKNNVNTFIDYNNSQDDMIPFFIETYLKEVTGMDNVSNDVMNFYLSKAGINTDEINETTLTKINKDIENQILPANYDVIENYQKDIWYKFIKNRVNTEYLEDEDGTTWGPWWGGTSEPGTPPPQIIDPTVGSGYASLGFNWYYPGESRQDTDDNPLYNYGDGQDEFKINYDNEVRMANIYYEEEIKK